MESYTETLFIRKGHVRRKSEIFRHCVLKNVKSCIMSMMLEDLFLSLIVVIHIRLGMVIYFNKLGRGS